MGLIMLILIGTVPTAYALNHAVTRSSPQDFIAVSAAGGQRGRTISSPDAVVGDPREDVTDLHPHQEFTPNTVLALRTLINDIGNEMANYKELRYVPQDRLRNFRNDMYLVSEACGSCRSRSSRRLPPPMRRCWRNYKKHIDPARSSFRPG